MSERIFATTDDEREAELMAETLWVQDNRPAIVVSVLQMHLARDPLAPRTTNRYAVIVKDGR